MGEGAEDVVVADAGPLIHLHEIERLPLLRVFARVHLPLSVWDEVVTSGRVPETDIASATPLQKHVVSAEERSPWANHPQGVLQVGEVDALALSRRLGAHLFLTDDLQAREAAKAIGIRPVGSLGIVVRAFQLGQLPRSEAQDAMERLYSVSSLFVTRAIVELAIDQLRT